MGRTEQLKEKIRQQWGYMPKILVGAPTYDYKDYVLKRYADRIKELNYEDYDIMIADNSKDPEHVKLIEEQGLPVEHIEWSETARQRMVDSRNWLRKYALDRGYDFFFDLETDVIPPRDILLELLQWGKKVISGWYYVYPPKESRPCLSRPWVEREKGFKKDLYGTMADNRLMRVYMATMGALLIHKDILERVRFRHVTFMERFCDDTLFFKDLEKKGIPVYVDTDMLCPHFQSDWTKIKR